MFERLTEVATTNKEEDKRNKGTQSKNQVLEPAGKKIMSTLFREIYLTKMAVGQSKPHGKGFTEEREEQLADQFYGLNSKEMLSTSISFSQEKQHL